MDVNYNNYATSETINPACNIPIVPDRSCSDNRGMINKVIKLKHIYMYMYEG